VANAHEGYLEHEWAVKTLRRLESIEDAMSSEHMAAAKVLQLVAYHIREEENSLWNDVEQHFDDEMRIRMNHAVRSRNCACACTES
jgi:hemerythrin-like domain-containing protein